MLRRVTRAAVILGALLGVVALAYVLGYSDGDQGRPMGLIADAIAAPGKELTPTQKIEDPDVYFPGTEELAPDEMRLISCGTGMPTARESQAATCWLLELGNGDKFIFDAGTGSAPRIASLRIPYEFLEQDLHQPPAHRPFRRLRRLLHRRLGGRAPGPAPRLGAERREPETGTKYAIEHWQKALTWDVEGRAGTPPRFGRQGDRPRVRLQGRERRRLPGERRHDPLLAGQPRDRRTGQLQPGVERAQVRLRWRHLSQQVVRQVREGRRPGDPRVLHRRAGHDLEVRLLGRRRRSRSVPRSTRHPRPSAR